MMNWRDVYTSNWIGPVVGGVVGIVISLPLLSYHFASDQGINATIADALLRGGLPYRDAYDFRPPGIFYAYYIPFLIFGRAEASVRIVEILAIGAACAGLTQLGSRRFRSRAVGLLSAALLPLVYVSYPHRVTAQPESFQVPFIVWSLALWPLPGEGALMIRRCFLSGMLVGAAVLIKTPAALIGVGLLLDRYLIDRQERLWKQRFAPTGCTLAGMMILPATILVYYGFRGVLPMFLDAVLVFGPRYAMEYSNHSLGAHWSRIQEIPSRFFAWPGQILLLWGLARGLRLRRDETLRWIYFLLIASLSVVIQGKYIDYHHHILLPFAALAIGMCALREQSQVETVAPSKNRLRRLLLAGRLTLLAVTVASLIGRNTSHWSQLSHPVSLSPEQDRECEHPYFSLSRNNGLAQEIRKRTNPEDRIFLWANEPLVYFLSDRPMAGPYSHMILIVAPWVAEQRVYSLLARLDLERPRLIVTGAGDAIWRKEDSEALLTVYPEVLEFLRDHYRETTGFDKYRLWERVN